MPYTIVKATWDMMTCGGEEMFDNELFSDAKVTVGDKTWPIHKAIVCPRSTYFRKAFMGRFIEAGQSHLTIEDQDSEAVGQILHYLYTGERKLNPILA
ncbi:hypothetical protein PG990_011610 [Apiospora arundinis]